MKTSAIMVCAAVLASILLTTRASEMPASTAAATHQFKSEMWSVDMCGSGYLRPEYGEKSNFGMVSRYYSFKDFVDDRTETYGVLLRATALQTTTNWTWACATNNWQAHYSWANIAVHGESQKDVSVFTKDQETGTWRAYSQSGVLGLYCKPLAVGEQTEVIIAFTPSESCHAGISSTGTTITVSRFYDVPTFNVRVPLTTTAK